MVQTITRDKLGAWLLKCNPVQWDLRAFRATGETRVTSWAVQPNYRSALMRAGDRALFWVSGPGRGDLVRGLWGGGTVAAEAEDWVDAEPGFWRAEVNREAVRGRVTLDLELWSEPVTDAELRSRGVHDLEVQVMPYGSNPSWVTTAQLDVIDELAGR